jgi:hypothetical protein
LENQLKELKKDKENAINTLHFEQAAFLRAKEDELRQRYRQIKERWESPNLLISQQERLKMWR